MHLSGRSLLRRTEKRECAVCYAGVSLTAEFCSRCGAHLNDPEAQALYIVDTATGLFNDRFLRPLLEDELARVHDFGRTLGIVIVQPEETSPAPEGGSDDADQVLKLTASAVANTLGDTDTPGVLSRRPPALLALLPEADLNSTGATAATLMHAVDEALSGLAKRASVGIVCVFPGERIPAGAAIEAAQRALRLQRPELLGRESAARPGPDW
jgi:PleD family two-component response regulator